MADGEGYNILFEGARKNDLAALLTEYTPDQVKAAWSEYLDMHVDAGSEYSLSYAARIFTETAEQVICVLSRRAQKEREREELIRATTESVQRPDTETPAQIPDLEPEGDFSELARFPELDLSTVPELNTVGD